MAALAELQAADAVPQMALMSPATTGADVDRHTEVFREAVLELAAALQIRQPALRPRARVRRQLG